MFRIKDIDILVVQINRVRKISWVNQVIIFLKYKLELDTPFPEMVISARILPQRRDINLMKKCVFDSILYR